MNKPIPRVVLLVPALALLLAGPLLADSVTSAIPANAAPRVRFGAERIAAELAQIGRETSIVGSASPSPRIRIEVLATSELGAEGFELKSTANQITVRGGGDSGAL